MPVRYGPARITFSGDEGRAQDYLDQALHLLRRTEERARLGGLHVLGDQMRLDGDSYCYAVIAGGIAAVHIVAGHVAEDDTEITRTVEIPDFVSGVIRGGYIEQIPANEEAEEHKTLRSFKPTQSSAKGYGLAHAYQDMDRLAVEPYEGLTGLTSSSSNSPLTNSQYTKLKPTLYSGTMRRVVQVLMGFGRQRSIGGVEYSRYDTLPEKDVPNSKARLTTYQRAVASKGLQIRYDWRFARTHGLTRAVDGKWWVVEISVTQGVIAMPLELNEHTVTDDFLHKLEDAGDTDAMAVVGLVGGFPTGEGFPPGTQMEAWVRAGRVVRLADKHAMGDFYDIHAAYSSVMGWAFNSSGSEAHNTAWRMESDGYMRGIHDVVRITIGKSDRFPQRVTGQRGQLIRLLGELAGNPAYEPGLDAAIWKVRRLSDSEVASALSRGGAGAVYDWLNALVLDPMATGNATRTRANEGYLVHGGKTGSLIKFPEPAVGLLVSVDMSPALVHEDKVTVSNTIVHVFFVGEALKWVKYFNDGREGRPGFTEDDYEQCMLLGSWHRHQQIGTSRMLPGFYTNEFDDRAEVPPATIDTTIRSIDLGYVQVSVDDCLPWLQFAKMARNKRFLTTTTTTTVTGKRVDSGVAVPFMDREAYYYAVFKDAGGKSVQEAQHYQYQADPWSYRTSRWVEGYGGIEHPDGCGPWIRQRTVMLPWHDSVCTHVDPANVHGAGIYEPQPCSDVADEGQWSSLCDNADARVYLIPESPLTPPSLVNPPREAGYEVWLVSSSLLGPQKTAAVASDYFGLWPLISPFNGDANVSADQYIEETHNVMGLAQSMRYETDLNSGFKTVGNPNWDEMNSDALTYIGVIDSG